MVVHGFLLHNSKSLDQAGGSKSEDEVVVWASRFYDSEGNDKRSCVRAKAVARRVQQEFRVSRCEGNMEDGKGLWHSRAQPANHVSRGVFRLSSSRIFSKPKVVFWIHKSEALCTLICEEKTNVLLAANQLGLIANAIADHFGPEALQGAKWVNQRPEELYMVLDRLIPSGHLQFLTEVDVKKELADLVASLQKSAK
ncbi:hypothetical protein AAMO2058_000214700 [Amorphochlora amoebiformis]